MRIHRLVEHIGRGRRSTCMYHIEIMSNLTGRQIFLIRGPLQKHFTFPDGVVQIVKTMLQ
jgi:hypothetical protein